MADSSFRILRRRRSQSSASSDASALPFWHYLAAAVLGAANTLSFAPTPHGGWVELVDLHAVLCLAFAHERLEKRRDDRLGVRLRQFRDGRLVALRQHAFLRRHGRAARGRGRRAVFAVSRDLSGGGGGRVVAGGRPRALRRRKRHCPRRCLRRTALRSDLARRVRFRERLGARRMAARARLHRLSVARERLCASRRPARGIRGDRGRVWRRLGACARGGARRAGQSSTPEALATREVSRLRRSRWR